MRHLITIGLLISALSGCTNDTFTSDDTTGDGAVAGDGALVESGKDGGDPSDAPTIGDASSGDSQTVDVASPPTHYRIFVTKQTFTGNLGGLAGADALCTTAATNASLGGTGHWKAWMSSSQEDAKSRLFHSTVPYVRIDGVEISSDWAHFTMGTGHSAAITIDEYDDDVNATDASPTRWVMTSTDEYGSAWLDLGDCADYTDGTTANLQTIAGNTSSDTGQAWTQNTAWVCTMLASLYCVEQP